MVLSVPVPPKEGATNRVDEKKTKQDDKNSSKRAAEEEEKQSPATASPSAAAEAPPETDIMADLTTQIQPLPRPENARANTPSEPGAYACAGTRYNGGYRHRSTTTTAPPARSSTHNHTHSDTNRESSSLVLRDTAGDIEQQQQQQQPSTTNLAVANLVVVDEEHDNRSPAGGLDLPQAAEVDQQEEATKRAQRQKDLSRRTRWMVGGTVFVVVLVVVILVLVVVRSSSTTTTGNKATTVGANTTDAYAEEMEANKTYVLSLFPNYTLEALEDTGSSQSLAYDWLLQDPFLMEYEDWRIRQRYALATLYYATNGDRWKKNDYWLQYTMHEVS